MKKGKVVMTVKKEKKKLAKNLNNIRKAKKIQQITGSSKGNVMDLISDPVRIFIHTRINEGSSLRQVAEELKDQFPEEKLLPSRSTLTEYYQKNLDLFTVVKEEKEFNSKKIKIKAEGLNVLRRHIYHTSVLQDEIDTLILKLIEEVNLDERIKLFNKISNLKRDTREDLRVIGYSFTQYQIKVTVEEEETKTLEEISGKEEPRERVARIAQKYQRRLTISKKTRTTRTS